MNFKDLMILGEIRNGVKNCKRYLEPRISEEVSYLYNFYNYAWKYLPEYLDNPLSSKFTPEEIFDQISQERV